MAETRGLENAAGHLHSRFDASERAEQQKVFQMMIPIRSRASSKAIAAIA